MNGDVVVDVFRKFYGHFVFSGLVACDIRGFCHKAEVVGAVNGTRNEAIRKGRSRAAVFGGVVCRFHGYFARRNRQSSFFDGDDVVAIGRRARDVVCADACARVVGFCRKRKAEVVGAVNGAAQNVEVVGFRGSFAVNHGFCRRLDGYLAFRDGERSVLDGCGIVIIVANSRNFKGFACAPADSVRRGINDVKFVRAENFARNDIAILFRRVKLVAVSDGAVRNAQGYFSRGNGERAAFESENVVSVRRAYRNFVFADRRAAYVLVAGKDSLWCSVSLQKSDERWRESCGVAVNNGFVVSLDGGRARSYVDFAVLDGYVEVVGIDFCHIHRLFANAVALDVVGGKSGKKVVLKKSFEFRGERFADEFVGKRRSLVAVSYDGVFCLHQNRKLFDGHGEAVVFGFIAAALDAIIYGICARVRESRDSRFEIFAVGAVGYVEAFKRKRRKMFLAVKGGFHVFDRGIFDVCKPDRGGNGQSNFVVFGNVLAVSFDFYGQNGYAGAFSVAVEVFAGVRRIGFEFDGQLVAVRQIFGRHVAGESKRGAVVGFSDVRYACRHGFFLNGYKRGYHV